MPSAAMCTEELLRINDDLNNVFLRFDRYERLRGGPASQTAAPASQPEPVQGPPQPVAAMPAMPAPQLPPPYPVRLLTHPQPIFGVVCSFGTPCSAFATVLFIVWTWRSMAENKNKNESDPCARSEHNASAVWIQKPQRTYEQAYSPTEIAIKTTILL